MRSCKESLDREVLATRGFKVWARAQEGACPRCGDRMVVQKTVRRHVATLAHGSAEVRETVLVCQRGCRNEDGSLVRRRSERLAQHVPPGGVFGYDVMVHVGLERFLRHRQREEIRRGLEQEYGITLSAGAVSTLARRFLDSLEALHVARAPALKEALQCDGGWPLHADATGEDGRGTLLVVFAGWRRWVLGSFKIPTERADAVLPCLHQVADRFGNPCAVMRDLGKAMIPAAASFVEERGLTIPVLSCHFHFLQDVGKDLLGAGYGRLRETLRQERVRPRLRTLARELGRKLGTDVDRGREALERWKADPGAGHRLPEGRLAGLAVVRGLTQWVLDFRAESTDRRFPFDRPLLDLYDRGLQVGRAVDALLRRPPKDTRVRSALRRLGRALNPLAANEHLARLVHSLRMRAALFDELRGTLQLRSPELGNRAFLEPRLSPQQARTELRDIRRELRKWQRSLRARRPARGPAEDRREAIDLVLDHLDRYGDSLFGHVIPLPARAGGGFRVVDRTNNIEENFFRGMKHGERRRSGRKVLTQDFERLPPAAALVPNLEKPDYLAILCGSLDALPAAFAELDALRRGTERSGRPLHPLAPASLHPVVETASLPAADRRVIRTDAMDQRIRAAAKSRPPRALGVS